MARPLRIELPGGSTNVITRGNERKAVFRDNSDRSRYLKRLAFYQEKFGFRLLAYCLMDNHVKAARSATLALPHRKRPSRLPRAGGKPGPTRGRLFFPLKENREPLRVYKG